MNRSHPSSHLSDDELIALLYGLGDAEGHLAGCPECGERWAAMHRAMGRTRTESAAEINARSMAIQRQQILERLERPPDAWRWVPVAAAGSLLAVALFLSGPSGAPPSGPAVHAESDVDLFTDVYSMERDVEPRAAAPIRNLFQETSFKPAAPGEESQTQ